MAKPLRVWATRPSAQNERWMTAIKDQGFEALDLPLMDISAVSDVPSIQSIKTQILAFDENQKVIFVSQNAVEHTFRWLDEYWPQLPVGIEFFAVGKKTAACVTGHGLEVVSCTQAMNSDELLALPSMQQVKNQKILICRGKGGLPRLAQVLGDRGAIVRYCELYHRTLPEDASEQVKAGLANISARDVIALFSGETLQNLVDTLNAERYVDRSMQIVVPGERVAQMASELGFSRITVAVNASSEEMLLALKLIDCERAG